MCSWYVYVAVHHIKNCSISPFHLIFEIVVAAAFLDQSWERFQFSYCGQQLCSKLILQRFNAEIVFWNHFPIQAYGIQLLDPTLVSLKRICFKPRIFFRVNFITTRNSLFVSVIPTLSLIGSIKVIGVQIRNVMLWEKLYEKLDFRKILPQHLIETRTTRIVRAQPIIWITIQWEFF